MQLRLIPATTAQRAFSQALHQTNMADYLAARGIAWEQARFDASWAEFENLAIEADGTAVGVLRLLQVGETLEIRDLQLSRAWQGRGIGGWAVAQAKAMAAARGVDSMRLRVYAENPARRLYARLGFTVERTEEGIVHMLHRLATQSRAHGVPTSTVRGSLP